MTSSRPYFLRALHEWIVANALTPHLMVDATVFGVSVPEQHVKEGKIVLNVSPQAVVGLSLTNDWVTFDARFSGVTRNIRLPMASITAIYALENGRGMVFEEEDFDDLPPPELTPSGARPSLKVVK
ncbi:MAG: ClpXP protease specificity-enhancing factor [Coxiellaceae bacterium]|nr:ClpXP protease specificity-enhancing factor [Coxiellaceae bacterium]